MDNADYEIKPDSPAKRVLRIISPLVMYFLVMTAATIFCAVLIALFNLTGSLAASEGGEAFSGFSEETFADHTMICNIFIMSLVAVAAGIIYNEDRKRRFDKESFVLMSKVKAKLPKIHLLIFAGIFFCIFGNYIINLLPVIEMSESFKEVDDIIQNTSLVLALINTVILAPISEELLCRGLLYRRCRDYMSFLPAAVISSVIFGAIHMNLVQFIYATLAGIVFAYIYERYQSVKAPMIAHAAANAFSMTGIGFLYALTSERLLLTAAVIAVSFALLIFAGQKIKEAVPYREYLYIGNRIKSERRV